MKKYMLTFLIRGLMAASGGPVVLAIVYGILGAVGVIETLTPGEVCMGILTVSLLAFAAAGVGVVYQIERLPVFWAALIHGVSLYAVYILIYLLNGWLKSQWLPVAIFTAAFVLGYGVIWCVIYICTKRTTERLNEKLNKG